MKNHFIRVTSLVLLISTFFLVSCISVKLPFSPISKNEKPVSVKIDSSYQEIANHSVDQAWMSNATGNTISYLSECNQPTAKLDEVANEAVKPLDQLRILKTRRGQIDSKPSSELIATGVVDNKKVKTQIAVLQSNGCIYSLVYGGLEKDFDQDLQIFEKFKSEFKVP